MSATTYIPVLRNKPNERQVIQTFGGLANFAEDDYSVDLRPLVEVEGEDDLDELGVFLDAGDELLVELPTYQTRRSTDFGEAVQDTLDTHGDQVGFYLTHADSIPVPVVSDEIERTPKYGIHSDHHQDLHHKYTSVAHRLMVRGKSFDEEQQEALENEIGGLEQEKREIDEAIDAVDQLETDDTVQVPLGGGAFVRATIQDVDEIVVDLGGNYAAERDQDGAISSLEAKKGTLDDRIEDLRSQIAELETHSEEIEQEAQQAQAQQMQQLQQQQQQQQQPDE